MPSPGLPGSPSFYLIYPSTYLDTSTKRQGVSLSTRHLTWCQEPCAQSPARNIELLEYLKGIFKIGLFTEEDLYKIVTTLGDEDGLEEE